MTCAEFESALGDLLASSGAGDSDSRWASLREHATSCRACAGSIDLLALAAAPASERDPIPDPGAAYWRSFDTALARRIDGERRSRRVVTLLAVAAAVVGVVLIGRALLPHEPPPLASNEPGGAPRVVPAPVAPSPAPTPAPAPAPVTVPPSAMSAPGPRPSRSETTPARDRAEDPLDADDDALGTLGGTGVLDAFGSDAPAGIFPDVDALSPEQTRRLLDWLHDEEARLKKGDA
jgi:hypothetical protein